MSRFLSICEEYDPRNATDPKWELIDFLKSKGIKVSLINNTDMVYIDTGTSTIAVTVSQPDEEAESIEAGTGTYHVDKEVEKLGNTSSKLTLGMGAAAKAKRAMKKRQALSKKAIDTYDRSTRDLETALATANRPNPIQTNY